jgi:septal ring factor EnvC (AmiA/AmiB activator)
MILTAVLCHAATQQQLEETQQRAALLQQQLEETQQQMAELQQELAETRAQLAEARAAGVAGLLEKTRVQQ